METKFIDILTSIQKKPTIHNIISKAKDILEADVILLYFYDYGLKTFLKNITLSGELYFPELIDEVKQKGIADTYFVDYILKTGSVFIEDESIYKEITKSRGAYSSQILKNSFWYRESIRSMAAIRLEFDSEPIGIMFFNYRTAHKFDNEFRSWGHLFAFLASSTFLNAKNLTIIHEQKEKLQEKTEKLQFEYEEIFNKMSEMIPLATRTSFYSILEGINHDIRNLLLRMKYATFSIQEHSENLLKKDRDAINITIMNIENILKLISTLHALFDFRRFRLEYIDTYDVINKLIYFFKIKISDEIVFDTDSLEKQLDLLYCVTAEFSMIFYNLINNSIYGIESKHVQNKTGKIIVSSQLKDNNFIFTVQDDGIGIDNNYLDKIYDPGFTTKEEGMGIGLYFVKQCVENNYRGNIKCESSYGKFARFTITIPQNH